MKPVRLIQSCFLFAALAMFSCSFDPLTGGSDLPNGKSTSWVIGSIYNEDGSKALGSRIQIFPVAYDPVTDPALPKQLSDTTDENGDFAIPVPREATAAVRYQVLAVDRSLGTRAIISGITISPSTDTIRGVSGRLVAPGSINVIEAGQSASGTAYAYIPGTSIYARVENNSALLDSVPPGTVPEIRFVNTVDSTQNHLIQTDVLVSSGNIAAVADVYAWEYSKKIFFNTTATGADVSGNVISFPMLVRLSAGNFNFNEARLQGSDLRFTKANGAPVPFEIEQWDSAAAQAAIWVKIDTVFGNNATQFIVIHWGNRVASSLSQGTSVFDTANGVVGAWHLGEEGNFAAGGYKDASANAYNGTGSPAMASSPVSGVIGYAQQFSGDSTFINCPALSQIVGNISFSVSFWMNYSPANKRSWILYFGADSASQACHFLMRPDDSAQFGMWEDTVNDYSMQNFFDVRIYQNTWVLATTVYDASNATLTSFVDGSQIDKKIISAPNINSAGTLHFGQKGRTKVPEDETGYYGVLDEVRICNRTLSSDWVKLCYESQRPGSTVVVIK